jgi:signal transduction histidine kinase
MCHLLKPYAVQDISLSKAATSYIGSSSFKMAVLFTLLLGMSTAILSYIVYTVEQQGIVRETEVIIDHDIQTFLFLAEKTSLGIAEIIEQKIDQSNERYYLLLDKDDQKLAGNLQSYPNDAKSLVEGVIVFGVLGRDIAAKVHTLPDGKKLLVGYDAKLFGDNDINFQMRTGVVVLFMFIVIFVSFAISGFVVSRINRIAQTAQSIIDTGDLSKRISVDSSWDDLSSLANVLNVFLERIEQLMHGVRTVSDNIAHDLRTPLTRLKNKIDSLDHPNRDDLADEANQLLGTFNALLRISNIETGKRHSAFSSLDLGLVLNDVIELYEPLAEEKKIEIKTNIERYNLMGDRDLLFQAFANILDNAVKFTPQKGCINLNLTSSGCVEITDTGPGVPNEDKEKIFQRFYRGEASRTTSGFGLGLSLVAAVIDLHGGEISLENVNPGLKMRITNL